MKQATSKLKRIQKASYLFPIQPSIELPVDLEYRCDGAGTEACDSFEREETIFCGLSDVYVELVFHRLQKIKGPLHVTGSSPANLNLILAGRVKPELIVKRCNPVNLGFWKLKIISNLPDVLL